MSYYHVGRGAVKVANRSALGEPAAITDLQEVPEFDVSVEIEYLDHYDTKYAISSQDLHIPMKESGKLRIVMHEAAADNLVLALYGNKVTETGGAFIAANAIFPSGIVAGETYRVPGNRAKLSGFSIVDSTGSPLTLALNTNYTVDLEYGTVKFIDLGVFVQPFKAIGTEAASQVSVAMLKQTTQEKYVILEGINKAVSDKKFIIDLYRVSFGAAAKVSGKGDAVAVFEIEGAILSDPEKSIDATLGRTGRFRYIE